MPTPYEPKRSRPVNVISPFSRFSPVIDPRFSYRAEDVVATLERTCPATGYPKKVPCPLHGNAFLSVAAIAAPYG
jgi:putative transposase